MTYSAPIVIAHRGASGYRPEHTLAAYSMAIDQGADAIEPDLVSTKDHVLIVRHENELSLTTDVADRLEYVSRRTTKTIDGRRWDGWFSEDFTLAEIRTLRCRERFPDLRQHNTMYDGRYPIATFDEVVTLVQAQSLRTGRTIGIFVEIKQSAYFRSIGLPLEWTVVQALGRHGLDRAHSAVVVQSFSTVCLRDVRSALDVPLVQLIAIDANPHLLTPVGLREISTYACGINVHKQHLSAALVGEAHSVGLQVQAYTMRNENAFLDPQLRRGDDPRAYGDAFAEYFRCYETGVDGVLSDNVDTAVASRTEFLRSSAVQSGASLLRASAPVG